VNRHEKKKSRKEREKERDRMSKGPLRGMPDSNTAKITNHHLQILLRRTCPSTFVDHIGGYEHNLENNNKSYPETNPRGV
jgi:hypothetical protein